MKSHSIRWQEGYRDPMLRPAADTPHLMVVIERGEARIYTIVMEKGRPRQVMHCLSTGGNPQVRFRLGPPMGKSQIALHGGLLDALHSACSIVVVGYGDGATAVVEDLLAELEQGHPDLSQRVYAAIPYVAGRPGEPQLLELARRVFDGK